MINPIREDKIECVRPRKQKRETNSLAKINYFNPKIK